MCPRPDRLVPLSLFEQKNSSGLSKARILLCQGKGGKQSSSKPGSCALHFWPMELYQNM